MIGAWRVGCSSAKLKDSPRAVRIRDSNFVLFRDRHGNATALADRCCHKGTPLSTGTVIKRHSRLQCAQHGWEFDTSGKCVKMPLEVDTTKYLDKFSVQKYATTEQDGYVWIWTGDASQPGPDPVYIPEAGRFQWKQTTKILNVEPDRAIENLIDWSSLYYHHKSTPLYKALQSQNKKIKDGDIRTYEVRVHDTGMDIFEPPTAKSEDPIPRQTPSIQFVLPDRVVIKKFTKRKVWGSYTDYIMVGHFVPYVSPETGKMQTRAEFMYSAPLPGFKLGRAQLAEPWMKNSLLTKDVKMLEGLQKSAEQPSPAVEDVPTLLTDYPRTTVRKIMNLAAEGQWNEATRKDLFEDRTLVNYKQPFY